MKTSRRDLFKFFGGTAVGAVFTPVPWRLVTDAALWSENWPGIPRPARGEIRTKYTNCALCPAGCAVRARCVGEQPVALAGVSGALCPFGLTGHHLPYHPARVTDGPAKEAAAAVADAIGKGRKLAVLDLRPGRTASWTYRRAAALWKDGVYIAPPQPAAAYNLEAAKTVLSLGAPLLEDAPARIFAARERFRLIQADAVESPTAVLADEWLRIQPGSEDALAQGLLGVLKPGEGTAPGEAARMAGIPEQRLAALAKELGDNGPALAIGEEGPVLALNLALGGWGRTVLPRREPPVPAAWTKAAAPVTGLADVADGSLGVLLIDESAPGDYLPWRAIEKKLARENSLVVVFGWSNAGYGRHAHYVLPTAVYPEVAEDIPAGYDSVAATYRVGAPLVPAPAGMVNPAEFIATAAGLAAGDPLRERADAIHASGRGTLVTYADGKSAAVKEVSAEDFFKGLNAGGCWVDAASMDAGKAPEAKTYTGRNADATGALIAAITARFAAPVSPLMSKLYQESNLRLGPGGVALHPDTAAACGVAAGGRAILHTDYGQCEIEVTADAAVPAGVAEVASTPEILDICAQGAPVKVVRA
jgi:anaerobic selenocysteine-containing dehydrogenase